MRGMRMGQGGEKDLERIALDCVVDFVDDLYRADGQPVDIREDLRLAVLNVIVLLAFGIKYDRESKMLRDIYRLERTSIRSAAFDSHGLLLDVFPWLRHFGGETYKDILECQHLQRTALNQLVDETMRLHKEGKKNRAIIDILIDQQFCVEKPENSLDITDIRGAAQDFIIAGLTTTSSLIYHLLNILLHKPEVQKTLQDEIDSVVPSDRLVTLEDKSRMPYTQAVIFEALRHFSNVSLSIPHKTTQDTSIGKYFVAKGTQVFTNLWAVHHDEKFWGDPYEFRPERFLDDGQLVDPSNERRKRLLPFGAGRRVCIGEALALIRIFLFIANMLKKFTFMPEEGAPLVTCDPRDMLFEFGMVTFPPTFKVKPVPRRVTEK